MDDYCPPYRTPTMRKRPPIGYKPPQKYQTTEADRMFGLCFLLGLLLGALSLLR